jgi:hypothetical protein
MARQAREEGRIASFEGFVRHFWEMVVGNTKVIVAGAVFARLRLL